MKIRVFTLLALGALAACGSEQAPQRPQQRTIGGQIGDSYKNMIDTSKQGVDQLNQQMLRTEKAVRERAQ